MRLECKRLTWKSEHLEVDCIPYHASLMLHNSFDDQDCWPFDERETPQRPEYVR